MVAFIALSIFLSLPQSKVPMVHVDCLATNHPMDIFHADTKKSEEVDNWVVTCSVSKDDRTLWKGSLVLPYPCSWPDASKAINDFRSGGFREKLPKQ